MIKFFTNKWVLIGIAAVVIIATIYFIGRSDGKQKVEAPDLPKDQPGGEGLSEAESDEVRSITLALHTEMKGLNFSYDLEPFRRLLTLSDTLFVAVYNDFNTMYPGKGTLRDWIDSEGGTFSFASGGFAETQYNILTRMNNLNLA